MAVCPAGWVPPSAGDNLYERAPERKSVAVKPVKQSSASGRDSGPGKPSRPRGGVVGQLLLVVGAYFAYSLGRTFASEDVTAAVRRGQEILRLDDELGFGWVLDVNHWALQHGALAVPLSMGYASLHYLVTPLVLIWLWRRHPSAYQSALFSLIVMSAMGLVVYITMPVAPPRLLPGFAWMDMLRVWSDYGWWGAGASAPRGFEHLTNQYAAVPSLHVGWAVWCAWAWRRSGGRFARRWGWLYPAGVAVTVVVTGNHYVLDVVTGLVVAGIACWVTPRLMARGRAYRAARRTRSASTTVDLSAADAPAEAPSEAVLVEASGGREAVG
ncbi:phosphatase PAP2 family protein [Kineosporia sp. J2-2]|uniref:Phosphatase PAP2 family protein n=1 Tax=Kineosporia corallincola TaxID=2835133 RepID=A0ABS5TJR2_9ACTN|nr:phosphatase PAP2 family protein [Kineosporia corallincola]MBT0771346.1 phosphatase PAP2 family protein [Kineosporia corallincola]